MYVYISYIHIYMCVYIGGACANVPPVVLGELPLVVAFVHNLWELRVLHLLLLHLLRPEQAPDGAGSGYGVYVWGGGGRLGGG